MKGHIIERVISSQEAPRGREEARKKKQRSKQAARRKKRSNKPRSKTLNYPA